VTALAAAIRFAVRYSLLELEGREFRVPQEILNTLVPSARSGRQPRRVLVLGGLSVFG